MLEKFASNAILAKSLAKYGRRLNSRNYRDMLSLTGVSEIANYLRSNTHYAEALEQVQKSAVHRGNLETVLRRKIFEDFAEVCRFESSVGEHFFHYILMRGEIAELMRFLRYMNAGHPEDYIFTMPDFFNRHIRIDLIELSKARSYDEMLEVAKPSPFYETLRALRPRRGENPEIGLIGAILHKHMYARMFEILKKHFSGRDRAMLIELFSMLIDFHNMRRIIRGKQYFGEGPDVLRGRIVPGGRYIRGRRLEEVIGAPSASEALRLLRQTHRYSGVLDGENYRNIDYAAEKARCAYARRMIRFSASPPVVMASWIMLTEMEVEDLTSIIEGVRYGLPPEEISKILIIYEGG